MSAAIGALQAQVGVLADETSKLFDKPDEIGQSLSAMAAIKARVDRIEPPVDAHEAVRNRGRGGVSGLSFVSGLAGVVVVLLLKRGLLP